MNHIKPQWDEKIVMAHLEKAASIHRRLPDVRVRGYHTLWPESLKDDWERFYDILNEKTRLGSPMPPEVSYHEEVMSWLRWVDRYYQQIIWMRANRFPWKMLIDEFGRGKTTLWHDMNYGLSRLTTKLNTRENNSLKEH